MKKSYFILLLILVIGSNVQAQKTDTTFVYQKPLFDFDYKKSIFKLKDEQLSNKNRFLRFSVFTDYREGVKSTSGLVNFEVYNDDNAETSRYVMYNLSIQDMLIYGVNPEQIILNVKDPSKYRYDPKYGSKQEWIRKNGHCYELSLPSAVFSMNTIKMIKEECAAQFHVKLYTEKRMTTDSQRYGLSSREENREVEVYIITDN